MEWQAFQAGNDILCFSDHVTEGIEKITQKTSDEEADLVFQKIMDLKKRLGVLDYKPIEVPAFNWDQHFRLQKDLAKNYVSVIWGELNPSEIQALAKAGKLGYNEFFTQTASHFSLNLKLDFETADKAEKVILSVFVPSHKPLNQFGMDQSVLGEIKALAKSKPCILVHFGNPLALKHLGDLENFEAVICAYQGFEEVQGVVVKLFL